MQCPFCQAQDTKVVDSRLVEEGMQVRRRRTCQVCGERFTTYETAELSLPRIIKSDGSRQDFSRDKVRYGLLKALEKRPVSMDQVEGVIARLERKLMGEGQREVDSRQVGEYLIDELRALDQVAYVRFASVYRAFQDVQAFRDEIEKLININH